MGDDAIPGTIGGGGAIWDAEGNIEFVVNLYGEDVGFQPARSVADRMGGTGINIGLDGTIIYGDGPPITVENAQNQAQRGFALVSQSDFATINLFGSDEVLGYFPGIVPGEPNKAVPLQEKFPALENVDFNFGSAPTQSTATSTWPSPARMACFSSGHSTRR